MHARFLLFPVLLLSILLGLTACDHGKLSEPEYPSPEMGVFRSDPLGSVVIKSASTSPDGDVFLLASEVDTATGYVDDARRLMRISPYGQTLFNTGEIVQFGTQISATADLGCVLPRSAIPTKFDADGSIGWTLEIEIQAAIPRPDGSVVLAGTSVDDTLFHVAAVNQLGMTLWETSFARNEHQYAFAGCLTSDGRIALAVNIMDDTPWILPPEWSIPLAGIHLASADGSGHDYLPVDDSEFHSHCLALVEAPNGGFIAAGYTKLAGWNEDGDLTWEYLLNQSGEHFTSMTTTADGRVLVLTDIYDSKVKLRCFDTSLNLAWTRTYGTDDEPMSALDVTVLPDHSIQTATFTANHEVLIYREADLP